MTPLWLQAIQAVMIMLPHKTYTVSPADMSPFDKNDPNLSNLIYNIRNNTRQVSLAHILWMEACRTLTLEMEMA